MKTEQLMLIRPDPRNHRQAIFDLTAKTFARDGYWNWVDYCRGGYFDHSHYDWSASTIGLLGSQVVTHWGVWGYRMRVGSATLRVAGIGAVATHGELRNRGLMALTAEAGIEAARQAGYDISVLFGIPGFYHRFGYVRAWPDQTYVARADRLPPGEPGIRARRVTLRHRDDWAAMYNRSAAGLTGTAVRPTYMRRQRRGWSGWEWRDRRGRLEGYLVADVRPGVVNHLDSCGDVEQVLRLLGRLAGRSRCAEVRFPSLHHDSELARRMRDGDCRVELDFARSGRAMVLLLDLASTLWALSSELTARLRTSHLAGWSGDLVLAGSRERATLRIRPGRPVRVLDNPPGGRAAHAVRAGEHLAQLIIGGREPRDIAAAHLRTAGDGARLADVLFPHQHPMLGAWDHF